MGNCATRSLRVHHSSSQAADCEEEDEESMMVLSTPSCTLLTKELPLSLHPNTELQPNTDGCHRNLINSSSVDIVPLNAHVEQSFSEPVNSISTYPRSEEGQAKISAQSPIQSPATKTKVAKRVTFAEDLVQTSPSHQPISHEEAAAVAPSTSGKQEAHQYLMSMLLLQREKHIMEELSASVQMKEAGAVPHNNILKKEEVISGVVRVKVVVSKKQLSELMSTALLSSTGVLRMQGADAFVQKTVAPLLPQLIAASSPQVS
ncbi:hypothetical protein L7F22_050338 [Adiantum nelumboides]|nr:hypothetical protein [Adiantum nelumboides]